ncbi:hypothetical protein [Nocardioides sp. B-3]|uniref:hypothetical protein n=1 Tax=Nocardioides sp. B-3 TaxID=2895565 RepID=UPI00300DEB6E
MADSATYSEKGKPFERDMTYIPDRVRAGSTPADPLEGSCRRRPGRPRLAGRARALPTGRGARLSVGQPGDHRAAPARPRGRHLARYARTDPRRAELDLRPRPRRRRPGARHRAVAGGLLQPRARLSARHHGAGDRRGVDRQGRDQRLPVDHPRPLLRVA